MFRTAPSNGTGPSSCRQTQSQCLRFWSWWGWFLSRTTLKPCQFEHLVHWSVHNGPRILLGASAPHLFLVLLSIGMCKKSMALGIGHSHQLNIGIHLYEAKERSSRTFWMCPHARIAVVTYCNQYGGGFATILSFHSIKLFGSVGDGALSIIHRTDIKLFACDNLTKTLKQFSPETYRTSFCRAVSGPLPASDIAFSRSFWFLFTCPISLVHVLSFYYRIYICVPQTNILFPAGTSSNIYVQYGIRQIVRYILRTLIHKPIANNAGGCGQQYICWYENRVPTVHRKRREQDCRLYHVDQISSKYYRGSPIYMVLK